MDTNNKPQLSAEEKAEIINDVFAEREAKEQEKKMKEQACYEKGWEFIIGHLEEVRPNVRKMLLDDPKGPVTAWFDNAAYLIEAYDTAKLEKSIDNFLAVIQGVDDEKLRIDVARAMSFVFVAGVGKKNLGNKVIYACREYSARLGEILGDSQAAKRAVVAMWRDTVMLRYRYTPYKPIVYAFKKAWFDKMIADIKAVDPKYDAPVFKPILFMLADCGDK